MTTTISIPDSIVEDAERLAKRRGCPRSKLYAHAVADFVKAQRVFGLHERLDAVYAKDPQDSTLDPLLECRQSRSLPGEKWSCAAAPGNTRLARKASGLARDAVVNASQLVTLGQRFMLIDSFALAYHTTPPQYEMPWRLRDCSI